MLFVGCWSRLALGMSDIWSWLYKNRCWHSLINPVIVLNLINRIVLVKNMARRRQEALDAGQVIEQGNKTDNATRLYNAVIYFW